MEFGLNLFSIRNYMQTEEDFLNVALKLKEKGYSYLQFSGSPLKYDSVKRVVEKSGMPVYLTHMPMDRIVNDTEKLMEEHDSYGCRNIGMGMMPIDYVIDEKKCKETIEKLNDAAMRLGKNGFKFFFHHHHYEFFKHNGQTVFDYMIENAPYINFTLDTYWLQYAGVDVCDFIEKVKGRIDCVHLKDYMITCKQEENKPTELVPLFCPIGDGLMNFKKIARKLEECGAKFYFVEQDNAALLPDTLEQVSRSADYIIKNL